MIEEAKYKIGDTVFVPMIECNEMCDNSRTIVNKRTLIIDAVIVHKTAKKTYISYCFDGVGDTYGEDTIMGTTQSDIINYINKYYDKEIETIEKNREKSLEAVKFKNK